ncbi:MAG: hypothetical protein PHV34_13970 [Verrucomicrobiae bacterium]|nr:hypothetical protein [Verrucomicrobiae bacterium]
MPVFPSNITHPASDETRQRFSSPFKLHTRFHAWHTALVAGLAVSILFNFGMLYAWLRMAANFSTPRIVVRSPQGIVLPVASSAFIWTPDAAREYVKLFLPVLYSFSPAGASSIEIWSPFFHPQLLRTAEERFRKNQIRIESEGLTQTLFVRETRWNADTETAVVTAELRLLSKVGQITRTPLNLTVEFTTTADPLNPYGYIIANIH